MGSNRSHWIFNGGHDPINFPLDLPYIRRRNGDNETLMDRVVEIQVQQLRPVFLSGRLCRSTLLYCGTVQHYRHEAASAETTGSAARFFGL